ncbi:MAG: 30S ribosomal protein S16 [Betaproteobacteria bacterium]|nr:30S ribosomal protein S16 [Betaproteobacteria bacterium]
MVVIRLARGGSSHRPFHHIVVTDKRNRRDSGIIERIGFFNPVAAKGEEGLRVAMDRITYWTGVGAQMSPTVARLVKQSQAKAA